MKCEFEKNKINIFKNDMPHDEKFEKKNMKILIEKRNNHFMNNKEQARMF